MNHRNRSKLSEFKNPSQAEIISARNKVQFSLNVDTDSAQKKCAIDICETVTGWKNFEAGKRMHAGLWKLFKILNP